MQLLEWQAKQLLREAGLPVLPGRVAASAEQAAAAATALGGGPVAVKAQVPIGGRGKAGGVRLADTPDQAAAIATEILSMSIRGYPVRQVLVEQALTYQAEYYLSFVLDRSRGSSLFILSAAGGMDIEEVATKNPAQVVKVPIDPSLGLRSFMVQKAAFTAGLPTNILGELKRLAMGIYQLYERFDAVLTEINPLALANDGRLIILDAKMEVDENALFRQQVINEFATEVVDPIEKAAREAGLAYVKLDGDVGVIGNGAGLVMATADMIHKCGGQPASFLDIGGGARSEVVGRALQVLLTDTEVRAILINIFGGITRCDEVAAGLLAVSNQSGGLRVPLVVRMAGTNATQGLAMLANCGWETANTLWEAANRAVVLAAQGGRQQ